MRVLADAAEDDGVSHPQVGSVRLDALVNLRRELPGRRDDENANGAGRRSGCQTLKQGQNERRGLARTRLRAGEHVAASEDVRDDLDLYGCRRHVPFLDEGTHEGHRKAQAHERRRVDGGRFGLRQRGRSRTRHPLGGCRRTHGFRVRRRVGARADCDDERYLSRISGSLSAAAPISGAVVARLPALPLRRAFAQDPYGTVITLREPQACRALCRSTDSKKTASHHCVALAGCRESPSNSVPRREPQGALEPHAHRHGNFSLRNFSLRTT